ncbi:MAG TPA: SpoIID/LytB domain-containing protein [Polyangia bacterium]|nr:SpoIID/LytB domain-containing protein [Polyangia bacterium]
MGAVWLAVRIGVLGIFTPDHVRLAAGAEVLDVRRIGGTLQVGGEAKESARLAGTPFVEVTVLDGAGRPRIVRRFRGAIEVREAGGRLQLVNELSEEEYLTGTVAQEARGGELEHPEMLKVQAVLARTLLRRGSRHAGEGFELCDLTHCEVFRGADGESEAARAAVRATADEVLVAGSGTGSGGSVAEVYFTAACGGATADADDIWPSEGGGGGGGGEGAQGTHAHLRSVPCAACQRVGGYPWQATIALAEIERAVGRTLGAHRRLTGLRVLERGAGGHVRKVLLEGDGRVLSGERLRILLGRAAGWNQVKSARFEITMLGGGAQAPVRVRFSGQGQGHGVGVCQAGAAALARKGIDYRAILERYLPGTRLVKQPAARATSESASQLDAAASGR